MAEGKAIEVIAETARSVATKAHETITSPQDLGRKLVNISRFGHEVRMSMTAELQFNRLLRRMYNMKGDVTHQLAVPHIDMPSDLERDMLLHGGVPTEHVASFFEAVFVLSDLPGRLLQISRLPLPNNSNLPKSLADLESITNGNMTGVFPFAAVSLVWTLQKRNPYDCISRFDTDLKPRLYFQGKIGFATHEVLKFPDICKDRQMSQIQLPPDLEDYDMIFYDMYFDPNDLIMSQKQLVAFAMNEENSEANIFYESLNGHLHVIRINHTGIFTSCPEDFLATLRGSAKSIAWVRLMAILLFQSLKLVTSFPTKEICVTLLEAVAIRMEANEEMSSLTTNPVRVLQPGQTPSRGIVDYNDMKTYISTLWKIIQLSAYVREAAMDFAQLAPNEPRPKFALTFKEMKQQQSVSSKAEMPKFSYEHRDRAIEKIRANVENNTIWTERRPVTKHPFETAGVLDFMSSKLRDKMRESVELAQRRFQTLWRKVEPAEVSGSLWLDRIAKGKLLTSERARELTKNKIKKTVPRELRCKRETAFYLPMYDRTIVFPEVDDLTNIKYNRMQIGSTTDLTSAVSVLVAIIIWTNAQKKKVVETAIKEDEKGTQMLLNYTEGELGNAIHDAFEETINEKLENDVEGEGLKISTLVGIVGDLQGERDNAWIVREVLSVATFWGMTCTESTINSASYLDTIGQVRSVNQTVWQVINANRAVPLNGVKVKYIRTKGNFTFFSLLDETVPKNKVVFLEPLGGGGSEELMNAITSTEKESLRPVITSMSVRNDARRSVDLTGEGVVWSVLVQ